MNHDADQHHSVPYVIETIVGQLVAIREPIAMLVRRATEARAAISEPHMVIASMHPEVGHPELFDTARNERLWPDYEAARFALIEALVGRP